MYVEHIIAPYNKDLVSCHPIKALYDTYISAARIVALKRKYDHVTPKLKKLHWLPVKQRIQFKILLLTYKCMNGIGPKYLSNLLVPLAHKRSLRSSGKGLLRVPRTNQITYGNRAFYKCAPTLWNALPRDIRDCPTLVSFKSKLKTHLFLQHFQ